MANANRAEIDELITRITQLRNLLGEESRWAAGAERLGGAVSDADTATQSLNAELQALRDKDEAIREKAALMAIYTAQTNNATASTLALGAAMRNTGRLYAFDVSGHRLDALKPRLARSGLSNVHPAQIAHERDDRIKRLGGKIDRVLVDAPCTGLGTLRRNPDLKWRQSPKAVAEAQARQGAILASASRLLKPGGRLVYATCSLLAAENEAVAAGFDADHAAGFEPLPALQALEAARVDNAAPLVSGPYMRLWPHLHRTDGFFAAVWQKR